MATLSLWPRITRKGFQKEKRKKEKKNLLLLSSFQEFLHSFFFFFREKAHCSVVKQNL